MIHIPQMPSATLRVILQSSFAHEIESGTLALPLCMREHQQLGIRMHGRAGVERMPA